MPQTPLVSSMFMLHRLVPPREGLQTVLARDVEMMWENWQVGGGGGTPHIKGTHVGMDQAFFDP